MITRTNVILQQAVDFIDKNIHRALIQIIYLVTVEYMPVVGPELSSHES